VLSHPDWVAILITAAQKEPALCELWIDISKPQQRQTRMVSCYILSFYNKFSASFSPLIKEGHMAIHAVKLLWRGKKWRGVSNSSWLLPEACLPPLVLSALHTCHAAHLHMLRHFIRTIHEEYSVGKPLERLWTHGAALFPAASSNRLPDLPS
jgi:hypothetical protein